MLMRSVTIIALCLCPTLLKADMITKSIDYDHDGVKLSGTLVYDDKLEGKRPGVLVVHDWMGHGPFGLEKAKEQATMGYVAFAVDMYGKGIYCKDVQEASGRAGKLKADRSLMRGRIQAAFKVMQDQSRVDPARIGAIGFCFGGTTALELARSGAQVAGVVSFHGGLETTMPARPGHVKCKILALHGADDPFVPPSEVANFEKEMKAAQCNWELVAYGNAVHSFTNPAAGTDNSKGTAYHEQTNQRSMAAMKNFFREVFGQ